MNVLWELTYDSMNRRFPSSLVLSLAPSMERNEGNDELLKTKENDEQRQN